MIVIKEYGPGNVYISSKSFVATASGYAEARTYIEAITSRGHVAKGDVGKVMSYFGG